MKHPVEVYIRSCKPSIYQSFCKPQPPAYYLLLKNENRARASKLSHITHGHETQPG